MFTEFFKQNRLRLNQYSNLASQVLQEFLSLRDSFLDPLTVEGLIISQISLAIEIRNGWNFIVLDSREEVFGQTTVKSRGLQIQAQTI